MKTSGERVFYYDNLKFILIVLVVIGHFLSYVSNNVWSNSILLYIYAFHMPLFIFITGFLSKRLTNKNGEFRFNRMCALLMIYFIFKVLVFFILRFLYGHDISFSFFVETECPWYVFALAIWLVMTFILKNINPKYLIIFSVILGVIIGYDSNVKEVAVLSRIIVFYPFFLLGFYVTKESLKKFVDKIHEYKFKILSLITLACVFTICYLFSEDLMFLKMFFTGQNPYEYIDIPIDVPCTGAVCRIFGYLIAIFMSLAVMCLIPRRKTFFSSFGSKTMQVYVLHYLVILLYFNSNLPALLYDLVGDWTVAIYIISAVILSFILSLSFFEKPFKKIMNFDYEKFLK